MDGSLADNPLTPLRHINKNLMVFIAVALPERMDLNKNALNHAADTVAIHSHKNPTLQQ